MTANINEGEKYSRAELKNKFDTLLLRLFGSSPIGPAECEPRIERQIQAVVGRLRFDCPDKKSKFIQKLRLACMFYWLLPEAGINFDRHSESLRHLKALSDLGWTLSRGDRNSLEMSKYGFTIRKQKDAEDFLAFELEVLFLSFGFRWRLRAIADLTVTTFDDPKKREKRRNGGLGEAWVRTLIYRAKKKWRKVAVSVAVPDPQTGDVCFFLVPFFTRPRETAMDVSYEEFCNLLLHGV